jgi:hypothetical protein
LGSQECLVKVVISSIAYRTAEDGDGFDDMHKNLQIPITNKQDTN